MSQMPMYNVTVRRMTQWSQVILVEAADPDAATQRAHEVADVDKEDGWLHDETWLDDIDDECDVEPDEDEDGASGEPT